MTPMERRKYRSNQPATALRFQLEATRQHAQLEALALADACGLLLAFAGEAETCEELGAVAPVLAHAQGLPCNASQLAEAGVWIRPLECLGQRLYLVSTGGGAASDAQVAGSALASSAEGVCRILQQQAQAA